ncbi:MAG TPA: hypothetical protein VNJ28_02850 [Candidatus Limnocylindrales bacterium]|nr:hypothetical protein [Candidatus Limnocylindrales bacterium]
MNDTNRIPPAPPIVVECPFCEALVALDDPAVGLHCSECRVELPIAPDEAERLESAAVAA